MSAQKFIPPAEHIVWVPIQTAESGAASAPASTAASVSASGPGPASGPASAPASGPGPASGPASAPASGPGPVSGPASTPASGPTGSGPASGPPASGPSSGPASGPPASGPSSGSAASGPSSGVDVSGWVTVSPPVSGRLPSPVPPSPGAGCPHAANIAAHSHRVSHFFVPTAASFSCPPTPRGEGGTLPEQTRSGKNWMRT